MLPQTLWIMPRIVDEDVEMHDEPSPASWVPHSSILKAGRQLSTWFFSNPACTFPAPPVIGTQHREQANLPNTLSRDASVDMDIDTVGPPTVPINSLPVEMLCEIFFHYTHTVNSPFPETHSRRARQRKPTPKPARVAVKWGASTNPIVLGHVCRYWRALAHSMPTLWSTIAVTSPTSSDVPCFAKWLDLSRDMPLDLTLFDKASQNLSNAGIYEIVRLAFAQSHRWKSISIQFKYPVDTLLSPENIGRPTFPTLKSCDLDLPHSGFQDAEALFTSMFASRTLRHVRFGHSWNAIDFCAIPWDQLTSVDLNYITTAQLRDVLAASGNLRKLTIQTVNGAIMQLPDTFVLGELNTLILGNMHSVANLLGSIRFPRLQELHLLRGFGLRPPRDEWLRISRSLLESGCSLTSLLISGLPSEEGEDALVALVQSPSMAKLRSLSVESRVTDKLLRALSSPTVLPNIASLNLSSVYSENGELSAMIQSRTDTDLRYVCAFLNSPSHETHISTLVPGVQIVIDHL